MIIPFAYFQSPDGGGGGGGADADVQAFLTATGITDSTAISALETLVSDLKTTTSITNGASLWDNTEILYPFAGNTANANKYNLKDTTRHTITWFGDMLNDVQHNQAWGVAFTGNVSSYGDTSFILNDNLNYWNQADGISIGWYLGTDMLANQIQAPWGAVGSGGARATAFSFNASVLLDFNTVQNQQSRISFPSWYTAGMCYFTSRNDVGAGTFDNKAYKDGVDSGIIKNGLSISVEKPTAPDASMLLGKRTDGFAFAGGLSTYHIAKGLGDDDITTLSTIINTFQTAFGRNDY